MKAISTIFGVMILSATAAHAQIGAKADTVMIPKPGGVLYLKNCLVTKIEPDGVRVMHEGGAAKVPYDFLPAAWKAAIPYDRDEAEDYRKQIEEDAQDAAEESDLNNAVLHEDPDGTYTGRVITKEDVLKSWADLADKLKDSNSAVSNHYNTVVNNSGGGGSAVYIFRRPRLLRLGGLAGRYTYAYRDNSRPLASINMPSSAAASNQTTGTNSNNSLHFTYGYGGRSNSTYPVFRYVPPAHAYPNGNSSTGGSSAGSSSSGNSSTSGSTGSSIGNGGSGFNNPRLSGGSWKLSGGDGGGNRITTNSGWKLSGGDGGGNRITTNSGWKLSGGDGGGNRIPPSTSSRMVSGAMRSAPVTYGPKH